MTYVVLAVFALVVVVAGSYLLRTWLRRGDDGTTQNENWKRDAAFETRPADPYWEKELSQPGAQEAVTEAVPPLEPPPSSPGPAPPPRNHVPSKPWWVPWALNGTAAVFALLAGCMLFFGTVDIGSGLDKLGNAQSQEAGTTPTPSPTTSTKKHHHHRKSQKHEKKGAKRHKHAAASPTTAQKSGSERSKSEPVNLRKWFWVPALLAILVLLMGLLASKVPTGVPPPAPGSGRN